MTSVQIGRNHIHLESVDSTNDYAMNLISKTNPIDGTVISASYQTKGKGQIGRSWSSDYDKNLMMSIIVDTSFLNIENQFNLSVAVSVSMVRFIEKITGAKPKIKWPNDIYIENKKVSGILIQNILRANRLKYSVLGIGVNVFQASFPSNITNVTSLNQVYTIKQSLSELYKIFFLELTKCINELKGGRVDQLRSEYHKVMFRRFEKSTFIDPNEDKFEGIVSGITNDGRLELQVQGQTILYMLNEVKMII